MSHPNALIRFGAMLLKWTDRLRKVLHLILLLLIFLILFAAISPIRPAVPATAALHLNPVGVLVDELSGDPIERALARAQGVSFGETLLSDLIDAVRLAASDDRIKALVLDLDRFGGAGLSKLQELAAEIERFKASGKPVYAVGSGFDKDQYFLAASADEILMHPMGLVYIDGYSSFQPYYKSALEKIYVDYNAWTVGEYKSFVEPGTRDGMSDRDREARGAYLDGLWAAYQADVVAARRLDPTSLQRYADDFVALLQAADGDTGRLALDLGLVDAVLPFDEIRARIRSVVGGSPDSILADSYPAIGYDDYLTAVRAESMPRQQSRRIGLIVASGTILDGVQPPGTVGSDSLIRLIRNAREDESIRALVLRIDSPGGSAFASDLILRELDLFRATGRPIVVSMGSVAASGGYWIATSADEIWASPSTLTGSIGVGATFPTFQRTLDQVGVHVDGLGTTRLAGQMDPLQGVGEDVSAYMQLSVEKTYRDFIEKVSQGRGQSAEAVEQSAQGRVWIGSEAQRRGLVDRLGDQAQAIQSAAELAGLARDTYSVQRLERERGWAESIAMQFIRMTAPAISALKLELPLPKSMQRLLEIANEPFAFLDEMNDPRGIYAYCFCDVR